LDPKRFGPKGTSVCILHDGSWMTPCEFRAKAKGNNGDSFMWKRQLKLPDLNVSLAVYIEQGHLKECDKSCECPNCVCAVTHKRDREAKRRSSMGPLNVSVDDVMVGDKKATAAAKKAAAAAKDNDSDSGISNVSSIAAAAAAVLSKTQPLPTPAPAPPVTKPTTTTTPKSSKPVGKAGGSAKFQRNVNTAGHLTSSDLTTKKSSSLPDYTLMVREAIASVSAGMPNGCAASQGCSRLCVVLYILTKYKPVGGVNVVNEKVKSTIKLLRRMGIVGKVGTDNEDDSDNEDEQVYLRPVVDEVVEQTPEKKKVKQQQQQQQQQNFVKVAKVKKAKLQPEVVEATTDDPEINFKPSQFYSNSMVEAEPPQLPILPPAAKKVVRQNSATATTDSSSRQSRRKGRGSRPRFQ